MSILNLVTPWWSKIKVWVATIAATALFVLYFLLRIQKSKTKKAEDKVDQMKDTLAESEARHNAETAMSEFERDRALMENEVDSKKQKEIDKLKDAKSGDNIKVDV